MRVPGLSLYFHSAIADFPTGCHWKDGMHGLAVYFYCTQVSCNRSPPQDSVTATPVRKAEAILNDAFHVLANQYCLLPSNRRFCMPNTTTQRARKSFVSQSIANLNGINQ